MNPKHDSMYARQQIILRMLANIRGQSRTGNKINGVPYGARKSLFYRLYSTGAVA